MQPFQVLKIKILTQSAKKSGKKGRMITNDNNVIHIKQQKHNMRIMIVDKKKIAICPKSYKSNMQ